MSEADSKPVEPTKQEKPAEPAGAVPAPAPELEEPDRPAILRPWPKVVFLYPTFLVTIACSVMTYIGQRGLEDPTLDAFYHLPIVRVAGFLFMVTFFFNMLTLAFDFTRASFLALVGTMIALILGGVLLEQNYQTITTIAEYVKFLQFAANWQFYCCFAVVFLVIYIGAFVETRFDYWELSHNELLHHRGFMGDVERFSAQHLRWTKEITDVFEYMLLLSGRIIFTVREKDRPMIVDNVLNINEVERRMERIQATLHVEVERKV